MALDITIERPGGIRTAEKGRSASGEPVFLDRRLFFQLSVFGGARSLQALISALEDAEVPGVLYADVMDPAGVALMTYSDDPAFFTDRLRELLAREPFAGLDIRTGMNMMGRTYAIGYEQDLEDVLLRRPIRTACNPAWPWAIWYPLRRSGTFVALSSDEQRTLLMEHGGIGRAYGKADLGHDIRLACYGLDRNDNDFVVALIGKELAPLSKIVEHMRSTAQTSLYISQMGPFFVGRACWQNAVYPAGHDE